MTETHEPTAVEPATPKRRVKVRVSDFIIFALIIAVIIVLSIVLYNRTVLKRDVANAQPVSMKAMQALRDQDGMAVWKLGNSKFQSQYDPAALTAEFKKGTHLDLQKLTLDRTVAYTDHTGRTVYFVYRYDDLKVPYYVRTGIQHQGNKWYLIALSSSTDPSGVPTTTGK